MPPTAEAFARAIAHHQAGRIAEAEALYRQVLAAEPRHAHALHMLGVAAHQSRRPDVAIKYISQAITLEGGLAAFHANLGEAYRAAGKPDEAGRCYQQALRLDPNVPQAHLRLGDLHRELGQWDQAAANYHEALRLTPDYAVAHTNLGLVLYQQGDVASAIARFEQALQLDAKLLGGYDNLARALREQGRRDEAIACYERSLPHVSQPSNVHFAIGMLHQEQGQLDQAVASFREALRCQGDHVGALLNGGLLLARRGQFDEAIACCRRAVQAQPKLSQTHLVYGNVLAARGMFAEAAAAYEQAIRLQPDAAEAYHNLAFTHIKAGDFDGAEDCCRRGLAHTPKAGLLYSPLATALFMQGRQEEALAARRKANALLPNNAMSDSNLVYDLNFVPGWEPAAIFAEHLAWAAKHAEPWTAQAPLHANDPDPARRIRVGYVSPYFREHAVNYFTEPILVSHDRDAFEIVCYSDVAVPDEASQRIKSAVDVWRDVQRMSDDELARLVRGDRIDILVDLTGHIGANRLPMFARKPAPVQVTYIGYQNTTGMSAVDYRLTDAHADPPGMTDAFHTEQLVRLPRAFFCYKPSADAPPVTPLPALAQGLVTFGSFNKFAKVTPAVVETWLGILAQVPNARLRVLAQRGGKVQERLHAAAKARGIDPARLELFDKQRHADYMRLVAEADIALDPFPFNGHTTTCDALWMGVPVVTLAGQTYVSRYGSSAHVNLGLESWIARSQDEYVQIAARAASDLPALAALRAELRTRMAQSPLLDFAGFTRNLEDAYRRMWHAWCAPSK